LWKIDGRAATKNRLDRIIVAELTPAKIEFSEISVNIRLRIPMLKIVIKGFNALLALVRYRLRNSIEWIQRQTAAMELDWFKMTFAGRSESHILSGQP
jgi:hypothetical protein